MPRSRPLLAVLAVAALAAAGCGSDESADDYVTEVNELQTGLVENVRSTVSGPPPTSPEDAAAVAAKLERVFDQGATRLQAIEPPEEVANQHAELVETIGGLSDRVGETKRELDRGTPGQAERALVALQREAGRAQTELNDLIGQINEQLAG